MPLLVTVVDVVHHISHNGTCQRSTVVLITTTAVGMYGRHNRIFGVIGGEVCHHRSQVIAAVRRTITIAVLCHDGCTCLRAYAEGQGVGEVTLRSTRASRFGQALLDDGQRLVRANLIDQHARRETLFNLLATAYLLNQARSHHTSAIGHSVIQHQRADGWHLDSVAITHIGQRMCRPATHALLLIGVGNARELLLHIREADIAVEIEVMQEVDISLAIVIVVLVNRIGKIDV